MTTTDRPTEVGKRELERIDVKESNLLDVKATWDIREDCRWLLENLNRELDQNRIRRLARAYLSSMAPEQAAPVRSGRPKQALIEEGLKYADADQRLVDAGMSVDGIALLFRDYYQWAEAHITALEQQSDTSGLRWLPMKTAPRDGTRFLAWMIKYEENYEAIPKGIEVIGAFDTTTEEWVECSPSGNGYEPGDVFALWQPLPIPPANPTESSPCES